MSERIQFEDRVLGGLPVLVKARIYPAEPDVGIFSEQVEIEEVCWLSGKPLSDKVNARITTDDIEALQLAALEA